jgi:hypothetical protein
MTGGMLARVEVPVPPGAEVMRGIADMVDGLAGGVPLMLEWRPIGFLATQQQLEAQWQRERGFRFWQSQRRQP